MISEENSNFNENSIAKASKKELITEILKQNEIKIPIEIFSFGLSPLESITKYLVEEKNYRIVKIAKNLNKNPAAISLAYKNYKKKKIKFRFKETKFEIPLSLFCEGESSKCGLSISEITTLHMREKGLSLSRIAEIMNKDVKTIWTFSNRGLKKIKKIRRDSVNLGVSSSTKKLEKKTKKELYKRIIEEESKKIPVSIFSGKLSPLESITKFLIENEKKSITEISKILGKEKSSISYSYKKSKTKKLILKKSEYDIPILFFTNNSNLSISEAITKYLHDKEISFSKISELLSVESRTVWTFYHRAKLKTENHNEK